MRRDSRKPNRYKELLLSDKIIIYSSIAVAILSAILIGLIIYSRNLDKIINDESINMKQMADMVDANKTSEENTESASSDIGKSVDEAKETEEKTQEQETSQNSNENGSNNNTAIKEDTTNTNSKNEVKGNANTTNTQNNTTTSTNNKSIATTANNTERTKTEEQTNKQDTENKKELSFIKPVEGEIVNKYARDNLIYSKTLEEWVTHLGIDIKAEKTSIVKAAESGTIKSIKNDPRYGLTVVIDHDNGYQTIYSNLLTAEFVVEGEKVEKNQTIGTVGNTAAFESADEPHLHFEILKNSIQEDPSIYIK